MAVTICDKCNKEVRRERRGSLTQWIFDESRCFCQKSDLKLPEDKSYDRSKVCPKCLNIKTSRRSGSMTQWIFKRVQCKCDSSELARPSETTEDSAFHVSTNNKRMGEPEADDEFGELVLPFNTERYKPLRYIARNSASVVYKCFDRQLGRLVAIKTLSFPDPAMLIRFQEEARATALLKHPNIVEVLDFGIGSGGSAFMVLEFVEATTLEDWLENQGAFSEEDMVTMTVKICQALEFAHGKGIYHRDLKPQNILLNDKRQPKLIDFGLALILSPELRSLNDTQGLSLTGTPLYMSPDQFLGRPYDTRSEVYSLGCVLFACLTGRPPFHGENALEIANQHVKTKIPALNQVSPNKQFSKRIQKCVNRCLEKEPELRYARVSELSDDLEALENESIQVSNSLDAISSPETKSTVQKPVNRSLVAPLIAITLVVLVVMLVGNVALRIVHGEKTQNSPSLADDVALLPLPISDGSARDPATSAFENSMETGFHKYLTGNRMKYEFASLLDEADKALLNKNASTETLYRALENYKDSIALRKRMGPVNGPDTVLTRALIGIYDIELRLRHFDNLAGIEKEIVTYSAGDEATEKANQKFQEAAAVCVKRNKPLEAVRCLENSVRLREQLYKNDGGLQTIGLELNIGTTYLTAGDYKNSVVWLERAQAHLEKLPQRNRTLEIPALLRLGAAYADSLDLKKSIQRLQAAEKLALERNDETSTQLLGQIYYRWGRTLEYQRRFDEADRKLVKAIVFEQDEKSKRVYKQVLADFRKRRSAAN